MQPRKIEMELLPDHLQGKEFPFDGIPGVDTIRFTGHLLMRMRRRKMTEGQVLETIRNPTKTGLPTEPNRTRARKNFPYGRQLDVVYERWDKLLVVVTAIWVQPKGKGK